MSQTPPSNTAAPNPPSADSDEDLWLVAMAPDDIKALTLEKLDDLYRLSIVDVSTKIWRPGMADWTPLGIVAGIDDEEGPASLRSEAPKEGFDDLTRPIERMEFFAVLAMRAADMEPEATYAGLGPPAPAPTMTFPPVPPLVTAAPIVYAAPKAPVSTAVPVAYPAPLEPVVHYMLDEPTTRMVALAPVAPRPAPAPAVLSTPQHAAPVAAAPQYAAPVAPTPQYAAPVAAAPQPSSAVAADLPTRWSRPEVRRPSPGPSRLVRAGEWVVLFAATAGLAMVFSQSNLLDDTHATGHEATYGEAEGALTAESR